MDEKNNIGDWNAGDCNTGYRNTGDWNTGDWNTGYFNTITPKVMMFNKQTDLEFGSINFPNYLYFQLTEWINYVDLTEEQKTKYPDAKVLTGWLIAYDYKEAMIKSFNKNCDKEQAEMTINLPNFDYAIFEEITGITKEMLDTKIGIITNNNPKEIIVNNAKYRLVE